jgi:hypothetical protein
MSKNVTLSEQEQYEAAQWYYYNQLSRAELADREEAGL